MPVPPGDSYDMADVYAGERRSGAVAILNQISLFFVVCSIGLSPHWRDIAEALRNPGGIARALVAVNVIVPVTALVVLFVLPIDPLVKVGIFAMAVSPIAPAA